MLEESSHVFTSVLLLLGTSTVLITLFYRLKISPLLAFLIVGATFGPSGFAIVEDMEDLAAIAELGLAFLLFILGLEFSLPRLIALRQVVFKLGGAQMLLCSVFFFLVLSYWDLDWQIAAILAGGLALSSTAIVSRELTTLGHLKHRHGEITIGILLFQDLAAVLLLIALPIVGNPVSRISWMAVAIAFAEGLVLLGVFFLAARYLLPRVLREIAIQKSEQLLVLAALVIVLLSATLTHNIALSMELGAFLAGMMLGDTRFRHQLEADIRPFRDLLLGLFFITIGMLVEVELLLQYWHYLLLGGFLLLAVKALIISLVIRALGESWHSSLASGLALSQGSEFLFAFLALLARDGLVSQEIASIIISIIIISMALTPMLVRQGPKLLDSALVKASGEKLVRPEEKITAIEHSMKGHILILGFGRVGQTIARFLRPLNINYLVLEVDDIRIAEASAADEPIYYGDGARLDILKAAGVEDAILVVISFDDFEAAAKAAENVKEINPQTPVLARTRDDGKLDELLALGVEAVIPETHEASLTLVSHILLMVNYPTRMIHSIIDKARRDRYELLKGFYHGERIGFLHKESASAEVIHAVRLSPQAWACGKSLKELKLPLDLKIIEVHRQSLAMTVAGHEELVLQSGDVVILRGLIDQLDLGEAYLLRG